MGEGLPKFLLHRRAFTNDTPYFLIVMVDKDNRGKKAYLILFYQWIVRRPVQLGKVDLFAVTGRRFINQAVNGLAAWTVVAPKQDDRRAFNLC